MNGYDLIIPVYNEKILLDYLIIYLLIQKNLLRFIFVMMMKMILQLIL